MAANKHKNCWDFWNCPQRVRMHCPAHKTDSGRECWMVVGNFKSNRCPKASKGINSCWDCKWFKELNLEFPK